MNVTIFQSICDFCWSRVLLILLSFIVCILNRGKFKQLHVSESKIDVFSIQTQGPYPRLSLQISFTELFGGLREG